MNIRRQLIALACIAPVALLAGTATAHPGHDHDHDENSPGMRTWTEVNGVFDLAASFVSARDGNVQLRKKNGKLVTLSIDRFSHDDRQWIEDRQTEIRSLNEKKASENLVALAPDVAQQANAPAIAEAFEPFAKLKAITYRWDDRYLYVESNGIPDQPMMVGIRAWQQQVPLPQKYFGANAWQIPLHPMPAAEPATAKNRFLRGAIAVAVNGVPIFNPLNNRGDDAYLFGELDEYGGHCGRADDYHYHLAPVHLEKQTGKGKIIAYALDGYPIYGYDEPDGSNVTALDWLNGHKDTDGQYHYHATKTYPYLNGGFYGEVTERDGQVDPQPRAEPVREAMPPLRGAKIIGFTSTKPNSYLLTYDVSGRKGTVAYTVNADGSVAFTYVDPSGKTTSQTYQPRRHPPGGAGPGDRKPPRPGEDRPPADGKRPPPRPDAEQAQAPTAVRNDLPKLVVTSSAFEPGGNLPIEFICDGQGVSPPVQWSGGPKETKCYVLTLWHVAPDQTKSYWVVYNIPATVTKLLKNSTSVGRLGTNDKHRTAYDPMCSKGPGAKQYNVTVYALSAELSLSPTQATRANLLAAIKDITLAEGTLTYSYERRGK
ncbi:MAG TPA: YHYH protein [Pirellulales bacterium]|nr:YHYH protein [Pirellulales bacterium]